MNGWWQEMDLRAKFLHLKSLTHGTLAKQGAPSIVGHGKERFNNLAALVYNNSRERGKEFGQWFLWEMIELYDN
jgi:hypothetical protein